MLFVFEQVRPIEEFDFKTLEPWEDHEGIYVEARFVVYANNEPEARTKLPANSAVVHYGVSYPCTYEMKFDSKTDIINL